MRKEVQDEDEAESKPKPAATPAAAPAATPTATPATSAPAAASSGPAAAFDAAAEFAGVRPGWTFKAGARGTGYYEDVAGAGEQAAAQKETKRAAGPPPPAPLNPPPLMTNAEAAAGKGAAAHTHDKGYKRWEAFDEEAEAAAVSAAEHSLLWDSTQADRCTWAHLCAAEKPAVFVATG